MQARGAGSAGAQSGERTRNAGNRAFTLYKLPATSLPDNADGVRQYNELCAARGLRVVGCGERCDGTFTCDDSYVQMPESWSCNFQDHIHAVTGWDNFNALIDASSSYYLYSYKGSASDDGTGSLSPICVLVHGDPPPPPAGNGRCNGGGNVIEYNGYFYRTLDGANPAGSSSSGEPTSGCQRDLMPVPSGFSLAPNDADSIAVTTAHGWNTHVLVFADGVGFWTDNGVSDAGTQYTGSGLTQSGDTYKVNFCSGRVLARCG